MAPALCTGSRANFGVPAKLYNDETDYADRMLEDVPAHEFAAAVLEPVEDAEFRGSSSGSNTVVTVATAQACALATTLMAYVSLRNSLVQLGTTERTP